MDKETKRLIATGKAFQIAEERKFCTLDSVGTSFLDSDYFWTALYRDKETGKHYEVKMVVEDNGECKVRSYGF